MKRKPISLHKQKEQRKEERRRRNRRQALEKVRAMTDAELEQLVNESTNDTLHAQARKVHALRQQARQKKNAAMPAQMQKKANMEQGCPAPISPDFAQADSWRDE